MNRSSIHASLAGFGALVAASLFHAGCTAGDPSTGTPPDVSDGDHPLVCMSAPLYGKGGGSCGGSSSGGGSSSSGGGTCGQPGGACCPPSFFQPNGSCAGDAACENGTCTLCGLPGESPCPDGCASGTVMVNGQCVYCGYVDQPACATGCWSGVDVGGTCRSCTELAVSATLGTAGAETLDVTLQTSASVPWIIAATNGANPSDSHSITVTGTGPFALGGLTPSATYDVSVTSSGTGCAPWTGTVKMPTESTTFASPYLDDGQAGDGFVTGLTISSDGTWTYAGHVHNAGFFPSDYALSAASGWKDASGVPFVLIHTNELGGTANSAPNRDDTFSVSSSQSGGPDPRLAANYLAIKAQGFGYSLNLSTDFGDAVVAALLGFGIPGDILGGGSCSSTSCQCSVQSGTGGGDPTTNCAPTPQ